MKTVELEVWFSNEHDLDGLVTNVWVMDLKETVSCSGGMGSVRYFSTMQYSKPTERQIRKHKQRGYKLFKG